MKRKDSLARRGMKLLCSLLGIVLVLMLGTTLVFRHYLNEINYTPPQIEEDKNILSVFSVVSSESVLLFALALLIAEQIP